jgi:hypothetical protein
MNRVQDQADGSIDETTTIPALGVYRHFKGGEYEILSVARHSETEEILVVYRSRADPGQTWVRPVDMFSGLVECPDGRRPRFQLTAAKKPVRPGLTRILDIAVRRLDPRPHRRSHAARSA